MVNQNVVKVKDIAKLEWACYVVGVTTGGPEDWYSYHWW